MEKDTVSTKKGIRAHAFQAVVLLVVSAVFYIAFQEYGKLDSENIFFLEGGHAVAVAGTEDLSSDFYGLHMRVYDAKTLATIGKYQDLNDHAGSMLRKLLSVHQGESGILASGDRELHIYAVDAQGNTLELSGGTVYVPSGFGNNRMDSYVPEDFWLARDNIVFLAREEDEDGAVVFGLVQDGRLHTLNLSSDSRFSSEVVFARKGLATLRIILEGGESLYIGQFLIDGAIPVVTEAGRDSLYRQYEEQYYGGGLIEAIPDPGLDDRYHEVFLHENETTEWPYPEGPYQSGEENKATYTNPETGETSVFTRKDADRAYYKWYYSLPGIFHKGSPPYIVGLITLISVPLMIILSIVVRRWEKKQALPGETRVTATVLSM